jgi:hypothetical protein
MEIKRKALSRVTSIRIILNITGEETLGKGNTYIQDAFLILLETKESLLKQESI